MPTGHPPLIDTHAHVYWSGMPLSATAWKHPAGEARVEDYLGALDAAGVHFGVLAAASIYEDYNDYMLDAVRRHRRLRMTAIVPSDTGMETLRAMDRAGVVGLRLQFRSLPEVPDLSSFAWRKLFRRAADLGWHIHLHDEGERLARSIPLIEASGVRLVIDHFGRPDLLMGVNSDGFTSVLRAVERGRTWVKLSAAFRMAPLGRLQPFASALLAAGPERLLWGSDWPFVGHEGRVEYAQVLADYRELVPDPATRTTIDRTGMEFYFG